jgi:ADP-heptose:LPS heptosyltransferase
VVHLRNWHWQAKNISMDVWFDVFVKLFEQHPDLKIVTIGGSTDHTVEHPNFVDLRTAGLNSQQMKLLCDTARCFVGIDSGPFQCAAASDTHLIALLTHLRTERIMPHRKWQLGHNATAIETQEECKGCNDRQQLPVRQIVCEKGNYPCTNNFDTQSIAEAILKTLKD